MTTIPFVPQLTTSPPFQANVTLDGASYILQVFWNSYRNDWYFTISSAAVGDVFIGPLIGSPQDNNIYLAPGVFKTSTIIYDVDNQQFVISP